MDDGQNKPPCSTDHVGSLLRPATLLEARGKRKRCETSAEELRAAEDAAVRDAVALQERAGLESITDGEFRRTFFHILVSSKLPALEPKDELKRRIAEAAAYVDLDELGLSPQCGFSSTVEGNRITEADEVAKLGLVRDVAAEVWS